MFDEVTHLIDYQKTLCECEEGIKIKCPACRTADVIDSLSTSISALAESYNARVADADSACAKAELITKENRMLRDGNRNLIDKLEMHREALLTYWHQRNRTCPCENGEYPKMCESPWRPQIVARD